MRDLFGLTLIERHLTWYLLNGRLSAGRARTVTSYIDRLLARLRPHAQTLVDAFGYEQAHLRAPIASGAEQDRQDEARAYYRAQRASGDAPVPEKHTALIPDCAPTRRVDPTPPPPGDGSSARLLRITREAGRACVRTGCSAPDHVDGADVRPPRLQVPGGLVRGAQLVALELRPHAAGVGVRRQGDDLRPQPLLRGPAAGTAHALGGDRERAPALGLAPDGARRRRRGEPEAGPASSRTTSGPTWLRIVTPAAR